MISREDISRYKYREAKSLLGYVGAKTDVNKSQKILQPKQMDKKMKDYRLQDVQGHGCVHIIKVWSIHFDIN